MTMTKHDAEPKRAFIGLRVQDGLKEKLIELAENDGLTLSEWLKTFLDAILEGDAPTLLSMTRKQRKEKKEQVKSKVAKSRPLTLLG